MDVLVGRRAQVVIPAAIREKLAIKEGDKLRLDVDDDGRIVLTPVSSDPIERFLRAGAGIFDGVDPVEYQRELRDEWEE